MAHSIFRRLLCCHCCLNLINRTQITLINADLANMNTLHPTPYTLHPTHHIHLVGIGGTGISAIAWVLLGLGYKVSGSDMNGNSSTTSLNKAGATVYIGHKAGQEAGADVLVISSAIPATNPEVVAAKAVGIPVLKRADFLGQLMADKWGIGVAGTHGKTTTTGMIAHVLLAADEDPSIIVGSVLPGLGRNGRAGQGQAFVIEADEYDHMFLGLKPRAAVITNLEHDHPDFFKTKEDYVSAFEQFVGLLPAGGNLVACVDDKGVHELLETLDQPDINIKTYGTDQGHYRAMNLKPNALGGTDFVVMQGEQLVGLARLRVPGRHNVQNALAAIIVALDLGLDFETIQIYLASFAGMSRRFQIVGEVSDVTIVDDYAHHPTEIQATLSAVRERYPGRRVWAVWQPHTYTRTKLMLNEFATSFRNADRVIALDIYRSRERDTLGVTAGQVVEQMQHADARHIPRRDMAAGYVLDRIRPGDVVLTLGAGDGDMVGQWILDGLKEKEKK